MKRVNYIICRFTYTLTANPELFYFKQNSWKPLLADGDFLSKMLSNMHIQLFIIILPRVFLALDVNRITWDTNLYRISDFSSKTLKTMKTNRYWVQISDVDDEKLWVSIMTHQNKKSVDYNGCASENYDVFSFRDHWSIW